MLQDFLGLVNRPTLISAAVFALITPAQALTTRECELKFSADTNAARSDKQWSDVRKTECGNDTDTTRAAAPKRAENKPANTAEAPGTREQKPARSYGTVHYSNEDLPVISLADFTAGVRQALARKVGNLGPYSEDLKKVSDLAARCPALVPARECELLPFHFESGLVVLDPFVAGAEPRKLYVQAGSARTYLPNTKKIAYMIGVSVETDAHLSATANQPCKVKCAEPIYKAVVIPEAEIAAIKQRNEESQRQKENDERKKVAQVEAAHEAERLKQIVAMPGAQKLVCRSVQDFIIKYGKTIRLRLNTAEKVVGDSADQVFAYQQTDTAFRWAGDGLQFNLDRTTLLLEAGGLFGVATYQCQKDQPQL